MKLLLNREDLHPNHKDLSTEEVKLKHFWDSQETFKVLLYQDIIFFIDNKYGKVKLLKSRYSKKDIGLEPGDMINLVNFSLNFLMDY